MFCASRVALGTMMVSQLRVSTHRVPPADGDDLALRAVGELHPVADVDAAVELQRDAAEDVAERRLQAEREHAADDGRRGHHRRARETPARLSTPKTAKRYANPTTMSLVMRDE